MHGVGSHYDTNIKDIAYDVIAPSSSCQVTGQTKNSRSMAASVGFEACLRIYLWWHATDALDGVCRFRTGD
jgi:hypothetical protein